MTYKKTFKERFESATFYTAMAMPVAGALGGAWLGGTSTLVNGIAGTLLLGAGGAMTGLVVGGLVGAAGFVAANALYKNKEYIALAAAAVASVPFALAARGFDGLRRGLSSRLQKMRKPQIETNANTEGPVSTAEKPAAATKTARSISGWLKGCFQSKSPRIPAHKASAEKPAVNAAPAVKPDNAPQP